MTRIRARWLVFVLVSGIAGAAFAACGGRGARTPAAALDVAHESCRSCRMAFSSARTAAQIVAPGEEPLFFDDVGCLRDYLRQHPAPPRGGVAYVADHRTGAWVLASQAVYTTVETIETPMASHIVAHADAASRDGDAAVTASGRPIDARVLYGASGPPDGTP